MPMLPEDRPEGDPAIVRGRLGPPALPSLGPAYADLAADYTGTAVEGWPGGVVARSFRVYRPDRPLLYLEQTWDGDPDTPPALTLHVPDLDTRPELVTDLWTRGRVLLGHLGRRHGPIAATRAAIRARLLRAARRLLEDGRPFTRAELGRDADLMWSEGYVKQRLGYAGTTMAELKKLAVTTYPLLPDSEPHGGVR